MHIIRDPPVKLAEKSGIHASRIFRHLVDSLGLAALGTVPTSFRMLQTSVWAVKPWTETATSRSSMGCNFALSPQQGSVTDLSIPDLIFGEIVSDSTWIQTVFEMSNWVLG